MGYLVDYFKSLKEGTKIDNWILDVINDAQKNIKNVSSNQIRFGKNFISLDAILRNGSNCFSYLPWYERCISYCLIDPQNDIISLPFSGCYFAKARYLSGESVAFHIHTDSNDEFSRKKDWNDYMKERNDIKEITIFNPYEETKNFEIWGIISADNKCFSIFVDPKLEANEQTNMIEYKSVIFKGIKEKDHCGEEI